MADSSLSLLVPGTLCDARLFAPLLQHWQPRTPVRCADLHTLQTAASWWQVQLAALPPRFDVIGFSLGGVLALSLIALAPERVRRLVLLASNALAGTPGHRARSQQQLDQWRLEGPESVARAMGSQAMAPSQGSESAQTCLQAMASATPLTSFEAQCQLNEHRPDSRQALVDWGGALMLSSGQLDPWCGDDKQALMMAVRPDARWQRHPQAGHYLPLECPEPLARGIQEFLSD